MQNQSSLDCKIEYCPIELPDSFPISYLDKETYSPSTEQVSFMHYHNNIETCLSSFNNVKSITNLWLNQRHGPFFKTLKDGFHYTYP